MKLVLLCLGVGLTVLLTSALDANAGTARSAAVISARLKAQRLLRLSHVKPQRPEDGLSMRLQPPVLSARYTPLLWDDFNRPDTTEPDLGWPLVGGKWILIGTGGAAPCQWGMVKDTYATASQYGLSKTVYACQLLAAEPVRLEAVFRWEQIADDGPDGTFVLAMGPDIGWNWIANIVHIRFHRNAVIYDTIVNWVMRSEVAARRFSDNPLAYGVDHVGEVWIDWDKPSLIVVLDGELMFSVSDEVMKGLRGPRAFWETYYGNEAPKSKVLIGAAAAYGRTPVWVNGSPATRQAVWESLQEYPPTPNMPEDVTATDGEDGVLLEWTDTNDGEALTDVEMARSAVGPWSWLKTVEAGETNWLWTNANSGVTYWFRLRARNVGGWSNWTEPIQVETK